MTGIRISNLPTWTTTSLGGMLVPVDAPVLPTGSYTTYKITLAQALGSPLSGVTGAGFLAYTGNGYVSRTFTGGTKIYVNNGDGSSNPTINHDSSTVNVGTYGTGSSIPSITIDQQGHITSASGIAVDFGSVKNITITGTTNQISVSGPGTTYTSGSYVIGLPSTLTFAGITVNGGTFNTPSVSGAVISNATISGTNSLAGSIVGGTLSGNTFVNASLSGLSLSGATLVNPTVSGGTLDGVLITNSTYSGGTVQTVTLSGTNTLTGNIVGGTLSGSTFSGGTVQTVTLSGTSTLTGTISGGTLSGSTLFSGTVQGSTLSGTNTVSGTLSGGTLSGSTLSSGTVQGSTLSGTNLVSGTLSGGTLSGSTLSSGTVQGGTFSGSIAATSVTISGGTFSGPTLNTVTLSGGTINGASIGLTSSSTGSFSTAQVITLRFADNSTMTTAPIAAGGTVTFVGTQSGLTGGPITTSGTLGLSTTTVSAGSYGSASAIPVLTFDAFGRTTSATTVAFSSGQTLAQTQATALSF